MNHVPGNAQIARLLANTLEQVTELAKTGKYGHLALALCEHPPGSARVVYGGLKGLLPNSWEAIEKLGEMMKEDFNNCLPPARNFALGADYVCYNIAIAPASYDFLSWLVDAEMTRVREGAPAPLKVAFWCGRDGRAGLDMPSRRQMLENVLRPMLSLIGAVEDQAAVHGRQKDFYTLRDVVAAARNGERIPKLRPMQCSQVQEFAGCVTITLRESQSDSERNSQVVEWLNFAEWLTGRGERVVFVRDTAMAYEPFNFNTTYPRASTDLGIRVSLYAAAKCNLFVSNGPQSLALFMDAPWLAFFESDPEGSGTMNTPSFWAEHMVPVGEQFPWCRPDQRLTWKADTYENMVAEWERGL